MKLLLIHPPSGSPLMDKVFLFEPLALEYLGAGALLDGHSVRLLDARLEPDIESAMKAFQPEVVGMTAFTSQVNIARKLAAQLRRLAPGALILIGGHHATVQPADFNSENFDLVIIGEGVFALREILAAAAGSRQWQDICGLGIPSAEGMTFTTPRTYTPLDDLPLPDRSLTAPYRQHYFSEWFTPLASIRTSLGCTARCCFCALWSITGGRYLHRSPESVVTELAGIAEPNIFFCDDESMCQPKRMDRLADLIASAGIRKKYFLYARADTIVKHPLLFSKWAGIGLSQVFVGMEDCSDRRLAAMNKGITVDQQEKAAAILKDLGIMMYASFMVDPDYRRSDFQSLRAYIRKLRLNYATFTVMTPLPGTELYTSRQKDLLSTRPELFDMLHALLPTHLPLVDFYEEMARLYEKAIPWYRTLPTLLRYGPHNLFLRTKVFYSFLEKIRTSPRDYL